MSQPSTSRQFIDLLLLRTSVPEDAVDQPYYTTGSIVAAALIRVALIGVIAIVFNERFSSSGWWWTTVMFALWGAGVYPAWLQYQRFNDAVEELHTDTLCGACRHFNPTNQLCQIMDVHVTSEAPPCEGEGWEPR